MNFKKIKKYEREEGKQLSKLFDASEKDLNKKIINHITSNEKYDVYDNFELLNILYSTLKYLGLEITEEGKQNALQIFSNY